MKLKIFLKIELMPKKLIRLTGTDRGSQALFSKTQIMETISIIKIGVNRTGFRLQIRSTSY